MKKKVQKWTCAVKCYYLERIWNPGEKHQAVSANHHFIDEDGNRGVNPKNVKKGKTIGEQTVTKKHEPDVNDLTDQERDARILKALNELDHSNDEHWTSKGFPAMRVVEESTGFNVDRRELQAKFPNVVREI